MTENTQVVTTDVVKTRMQMALQQQNFIIQKIQDEANKLEVTEDNLQGVADFIQKTKKIDKVIEEKHKEIKAPYLDAGRACDAAKNDMLRMIEDVRQPIYLKYQRVCNDVAARKAQEERRQAERQRILAGIESNTITYSSMIASCTSLEELNSVQTKINFEKARKDKYGEFYDKAIEQFDTVLIPIIKDQKLKIKEEQELLLKKQQAQIENDIEVLDSINAKHEELQDKINHNRIVVQENALNFRQEEAVAVAQIYPDVKPRRVGYDCEIVDMDAAIKKSRGLLNIELNKEAAKKILNELKDAHAFDHADSVIVGGIRYFQKTTW